MKLNKLSTLLATATLSLFVASNAHAYTFYTKKDGDKTVASVSAYLRLQAVHYYEDGSDKDHRLTVDNDTKNKDSKWSTLEQQTKDNTYFLARLMVYGYAQLSENNSLNAYLAADARNTWVVGETNKTDYSKDVNESGYFTTSNKSSKGNAPSPRVSYWFVQLNNKKLGKVEYGKYDNQVGYNSSSGGEFYFVGSTDALNVKTVSAHSVNYWLPNNLVKGLSAGVGYQYEANADRLTSWAARYSFNDNNKLTYTGAFHRRKNNNTQLHKSTFHEVNFSNSWGNLSSTLVAQYSIDNVDLVNKNLAKSKRTAYSVSLYNSYNLKNVLNGLKVYSSLVHTEAKDTAYSETDFEKQSTTDATASSYLAYQKSTQTKTVYDGANLGVTYTFKLVDWSARVAFEVSRNRVQSKNSEGQVTSSHYDTGVAGLFRVQY